MWTGATTNNAEETIAAGVQFVQTLTVNPTVALHGELGSGKTTFVKGMARGLGVDQDVASPTFALVHEYGDPVRLYHLDCYREPNPANWLSLGITDYFDADAFTVIEWAEIIATLLPAEALHLYFRHGRAENIRLIEVGL
ncbi:MAG: tRNA (adenosine(37)-N6)-threonylcarbamoyltransferase complex ATPase subunit type 1 TsaE [Candidatus Marinimicrobia bacterium]|nr:tRNA (adenosine(37)-N6)-threonylcarbamoyltransferase complex ATPase subunit type 1 TsaE [Candidatus Neomarinimicrobiota bacterium]